MTGASGRDRGAVHYRWGGGCDGWRLVDRPGLSIVHERMPPGTSEVPHRHARAMQYFFMLLGGRLTIALDRQTHEVAPLEGLTVAPGIRHTVMNRSEVSVEFLVISQPSSSGDRDER